MSSYAASKLMAEMDGEQYSTNEQPTGSTPPADPGTGGSSFWSDLFNFLGQAVGAVPGILDQTQPRPQPTPTPEPQKKAFDTNIIILIAVLIVGAIVVIKVL